MDRNKKRKIIGILIILSPYIHTFTFTGNRFLGAMYTTFYISKIVCWIIGLVYLNYQTENFEKEM